MSGLLLAIASLAAVSTALLACAVFERAARVPRRPDRPELAPPRSVWGGGPLVPPAHWIAARALAGFARMVRRQSVVSDHRPGLRLVGRLGTLAALAAGLAMLPLCGTWGGRPDDPPLLLLDSSYGLAAVGLALLLCSLFRVTVGLSERNVWSRIGSARQASRAIVALPVLTLVLAPLAIDSGSLRLHDIALGQQLPLVPLDRLLAGFEGPLVAQLRAWPIPAWNLFAQPLTAALFVPAVTLMLGSARVDDPTTGSIAAAGLGLDSDPVDAYWSRLDARLSRVLGAALFVTLFLGASSIPFVDPSRLVSVLEPYVGRGLPILLVAGLQLGTFLAKCLLVLFVALRCARVVAAARVDRVLRLVTRRLLPLAWANLLLVAAVTLWLSGRAGGAG